MTDTANTSISAVIPNWNGAALLPRCIDALRREFDAWPGHTEIIVVDDASDDGSPALLKKIHPQVKVIENSRNSGFGHSCNRGAQAATGELLLLLNTDVFVHTGFLPPLVRHFADPDMFAVSCQSYRDDGAPREGRKTRLFKNIWFAPPGMSRFHDSIPAAACNSICATGGHSIFDHRKFLELRGFDPLFHPFYWEDNDLCWRAWARGWRALHEPESRVTHSHSGVISSSFRRAQINAIAHRNRMLFTWKNLSAWNILLPHSLGLAARIPVSALTLNKWFFVSLGGALKRLPTALAGRAEMKKRRRRSDNEILRLAAAPEPGPRDAHPITTGQCMKTE